MISHPKVHYGLNKHTHTHKSLAESQTHTHISRYYVCFQTLPFDTPFWPLSTRVVYVKLLFRWFYAVNVPWLTFCIIDIFVAVVLFVVVVIVFAVAVAVPLPCVGYVFITWLKLAATDGGGFCVIRTDMQIHPYIHKRVSLCEYRQNSRTIFVYSCLPYRVLQLRAICWFVGAWLLSNWALIDLRFCIAKSFKDSIILSVFMEL